MPGFFAGQYRHLGNHRDVMVPGLGFLRQGGRAKAQQQREHSLSKRVIPASLFWPILPE